MLKEEYIYARNQKFFKNLQRWKRAVSHLNLTVKSGDIYGFIGHNGAGKTTTIKAVVGILGFEEGDILIEGKSIKKDPLFCKSKIAYIPDNPDLYEHLTGIEYLNFIADVFGVSGTEKEKRISQYGDLFEITGNLGSLIGSYSHGMKQKVALIGALIHEPKLLVLDEPFVGLDPKASLDLKNVMHELCQKGSAIFFSTHVLEVAEKLCNKIAIIKSGELVANGNIKDVLGDDSLEDVFMEVTQHEK